MNPLPKITCTFLAFFSALTFAETTVIENVNGYTLLDDKLINFHAIRFTDDKIDQIYRDGDLFEKKANWRVINGKKQTLIPGLIDAHGHILSYGKSLLSVNLNASSSQNHAVELTKEYAVKNPGQPWVLGRGWNQERWPDKSFPTADTLDRAFPDTPVYLSRVDGHAAWVNSKAMALVGITSKTPSPAGGEIIKDKHGKPTGVFIDNAMSLFDRFTKNKSLEAQQLRVEKSMHNLTSYGITSVHDAGIDFENLLVFKKLAAQNKLPIRVNAMLNLPSENWREVLEQGPFKTPDDMLQFNSVKIVADGALGSRGAALLEEYSDHKGHTGLLIHDKDALNQYILTAMSFGFQVNTHAIGDKTNKLVLDLYQEAIEKTRSKSLRHRIEHAQVLQLSDIPRFKKLGVVASMQATHATSDKNMAYDRLGERIAGAYAWRKLLKADAIIAAGSDFPVESPNPFYGLHASITRQDQQNQPLNGWYPDEKMTVEEAFRSFTVDAAFAGHQEHIIGALVPGKKADFILINQDMFTEPAPKMWKTLVQQTWVNGKRVFIRK